MRCRNLLALSLVLALLTVAACDDEQTTPVSPEVTAAASDTTSEEDSAADDTTSSAASQQRSFVEGFRGPAEEIATGWIRGRNGEPMEVTYEVHDGLAVYQGDIILGEAGQIADSKDQLPRVYRGVAIDGSGNHWPDGEVPFEIASDFSAAGEQAIHDAIELVERRTAGIDFFPRSGESDYVRFVTGDGCSSFVGFKGGKQNVNLNGSGSCGRGSNAHEMLHRLGQWHEQSRCDRDDFVNILEDNIKSGKKHNFDKKCSGSTDYAEYNAGSLMHYPPKAFSKNMMKTIESDDPSVDESDMGQRSDLALTDIKAMCALYCQHNDAPTADLGGIPGSSVPEGSAVDLDASGSTDPDDEFDYFHFAWTFGDGTCSGGSPPAECSDDDPSHTYADDGSYGVSLTVRDGPFGQDITTGMNMGGVSQGFLEDDASGTVDVHNVDPSVDIGPDETIDEGDTYSEFGTFTDPGADTWTAEVNYDDGAGDQSLSLSGKSFSLSKTYPDDATKTVQVTVADDDGGSGSDQVEVTVENVAPDVDAGPNATIDEGDTFSQSGSFTDPGADTWTATVDYDDGGGEESLSLSGKNFDLDHTYADDDVNTVQVSVEDDDGGEGTDDVTVTVLNVAPTVDAGMDATVTSGETFNFSGTFSDPGVNDDPWSWIIDWGDGTPNTTGSTSDQSAPITASHRVCAAGDYPVQLSVTDKDGGTGSDMLTVTVPYLGVDLDIKPGGVPNSVNLNSRGLLPVAVLSSPTFDATQVDPSTVKLGDESGMETPVAQRKNGTLFASVEDVNHDGLPDMALKFETQSLVAHGDLDASTTQLVLRGFLTDGCTNIRALDSVTIRGTRGRGLGR